MNDMERDVLLGESRRTWLALLAECRSKLRHEAAELSLDLCLAKAVDAALDIDLRRDAERFVSGYTFTETNLAMLGAIMWLGVAGDTTSVADLFQNGIRRLQKKKPSSFGINCLQSGRILAGLALGAAALRKARVGDDSAKWVRSSVENFLGNRAGEVKWQLLGSWALGLLEGADAKRADHVSDVLVRGSPDEAASLVAMLWALERVLYNPGLHADGMIGRKCELVGRLPAVDVEALDVVESALLEDALVRLSSESARLLPERDTDYLIRVLERFPQCLKREKRNLQNEDDVQRILWTMLRAHYDDLVDEEYLRRFGLKNYRLDIGIRSLRTIVEAKFVREKARPPDVQDQLLADVQGYFKSTDEFEKLVIFIYDCSRRLSLNTDFVRDLESLEEVEKVIIVPEAQLSRKNG